MAVGDEALAEMGLDGSKPLPTLQTRLYQEAGVVGPGRLVGAGGGVGWGDAIHPYGRQGGGRRPYDRTGGGRRGGKRV